MEYGEMLVKRIYQLCDEKNMTFHRLAVLAELLPATVDKIVKGKVSNPTLITVQSIALAFGMTISEFLCFDEMNQVDFPKLRQYKKQLKKNGSVNKAHTDNMDNM